MLSEPVSSSADLLFGSLRRLPSFRKEPLKICSMDISAISELNGLMESQAARPQSTGVTNGYLTVAEVALILGVAKSFIYRRTSPHHPDPMPCYRFGGHLRFLPEEVHEWAAGHRKNQEARPSAAPGRLVAIDRSGSGRVRLRVREPRS